MIADVNDTEVTNAAEKDAELIRIRKETLDMAQDKEVQNMLIQEEFERMDWLTYGNEQKKEGEVIGEARGDARRMEEVAKGMYAEGIKTDVIARILKTTVDVVEKILGLQHV